MMKVWFIGGVTEISDSQYYPLQTTLQERRDVANARTSEPEIILTFSEMRVCLKSLILYQILGVWYVQTRCR